MKTYEEAVAEFNAKKDAEEKAILDEHNGCHCPAGQHVWGGDYQFLKLQRCQVCQVVEDFGLRKWSCRHCGPIGYDQAERRSNELRKFLWDGQKSGAIAAPVKKDSIMSFLWSRK